MSFKNNKMFYLFFFCITISAFLLGILVNSFFINKEENLDNNISEDGVTVTEVNIVPTPENVEYENIQVTDSIQHKVVYLVNSALLDVKQSDITEMYRPVGAYDSIISFSQVWNNYILPIKEKYSELSIISNVEDRTDDYSTICAIAVNDEEDFIIQLCGMLDNSQQITVQAVLDFSDESIVDRINEISNAIEYSTGIMLDYKDIDSLKNHLQNELAGGHNGYIQLVDDSAKASVMLEYGEYEEGEIYYLTCIKIISEPDVDTK